MKTTRLLAMGLLLGGGATGCSEGAALSGALETPLAGPRTAPLANAGADAEVLRGFPAVLRGGGSYHPGGAEFSVRWEQVSGTRVPLSNPESLGPSFVAPLDPEELVFELTVDDGRFSTVDRVTLHVVRKPTRVAPTVQAGPDRIVPSPDDAAPTTGDVTASELAPVWEAVVITPSPFARVRREYDGPAVFRVTTQRDGLSSAPDYLLLRRPEPQESDTEVLSEQAPTTALVSSSNVIEPGARFELDASETSDANGEPFTVRWEQLRGDPVLDTGSSAELTRTLVSPIRPQELVFRVFANDGRLESAPAELRLVVRPRDRMDNIELGGGLDLRTRPERPVRLVASTIAAATDRALSFEWLQTHGRDVVLDVDDGGNASFAASTPDVLAFALTAADDELLSQPSVSTVTVVEDDENLSPSVFLCSSAQSPEPGQIVVLAARIFDPEGDPLEAPRWSGGETLALDESSPPSAGQTCAGGAPTAHGGPPESATVTSFVFEMPPGNTPLELALESCDNRGACTEETLKFPVSN